METILLTDRDDLPPAQPPVAPRSPSHDLAVQRAAAAALVLGVAGDSLLRSGASGVGFTLFVLLVVGALAALTRAWRRPWTLGACLLLLPTLFFAASVSWRDSAPLAFFNVVALLASLAALATALMRGESWEPASSVGDYLRAAVRVAGHTAFGAPFLMRDADATRDAVGPGRLRHAGAVARGAAIAVPLVLVFGSLLSAADPHFERLVRLVVDVDFGVVASHVTLAMFVAWVAAGYMRSVLTPPGPPARQALTFDLSLGVVEVGLVLGALDALFLAFVVVQVQYLFGGAAHVVTNAGVTYAEYARRGFFELVWVAALALPTLLGADALLRRTGKRDERIFRALAGALLLLLGVVMLSAMQRMSLYQQAYGLTASRLYASAGMAWLAIVFALFAATVLRGRRAPFAFGALVSAWAIVALLDLASPDAVVARTNLERARRGERFDADYLAGLSADATPDLLRGVGRLAPAARCQLVAGLLPRPAREPDWRGWNIGRARGDRALRAHRPELASYACPTVRPSSSPT